MVLVILIFLYLYVSIELSIYCTKSSILFMAMKKHTSTFWSLLEAVYISVLIAIGNKTLPKSKVAC